MSSSPGSRPTDAGPEAGLAGVDVADDVPRRGREVGGGGAPGAMEQVPTATTTSIDGSSTPSSSTMPGVQQMLAAGSDGALRRRRRSALYLEHLAEQAADIVAPEPKRSRQERLQMARAALAEKRAAKQRQATPPEVDQTASALAAFVDARAEEISVDKGTMQLIAKPLGGTFEGRALERIVAKIPRGIYLPSDLSELVDEFARFDTSSASSAALRSARLGLRTDTIQKWTCRLAAAAISSDHAVFRQAVKAGVTSSWHPLMYIEGSSYDETPMRARSEAVVMDVVVQSYNSGDAHDPESQKDMFRVVETKLGDDAGPTGVCQTRQVGAMCFWVSSRSR